MSFESRTSPGRVLLVEDEGVVAMEMERLLVSMGYSVCGVAATGEAALRLAQDNDVELVIMDIRLRGKLDGISTAKALQERSNPAVVFVTAHSNASTLERAKAIEPFGYVIKPFDQRSLLATIQLALFRYRAERERRAVREQSHRMEARLAAVLNHSHDGIVSVDHERNVIVFNRGAERMFGYPASAVMGGSFAKLLPESPVEPTQVRSESVFEAPGTNADVPRIREVLFRRSSGEVFPAEVSVSHVPESHGHVTTAFIRDVSERNRLEKQVNHAVRMHAVGRLAASVTHEFNNLLTALRANAHLLRTRPSEETDQYVEEVFAIVERGMALTRQLLSFTRLQNEQQVARTVNVAQVVLRVRSLLERLLQDRVTLEVSFHPDTAPIQGDEYLIEQVVMNLVLNARDAMPRGGSVRVLVKPLDVRQNDSGTPTLHLPSGSYVLIDVADSGEGIAEDVREQIFEPFFTTKAPGLGTGLGLSTVQQSVRRLRGDVWFETEIGVGTTFHVAFPVLRNVVAPRAGVGDA